MSDALWCWSAAELASAIRKRVVSSREVVQAHLERIDAVNSAVNAITVVFADEALAAADVADKAGQSFASAGSLHGVPITIKENIDVAGSATTQGIVSLKDSKPEQDAPVVRHLKEAGAIVMGRTNMPDYGMRWHTDNALHGPTLNPWDASRTPGGSSGGEAVAIATGMSPLGIGNDMGGSTRQPAVNCGISGLRPSMGRVSRVMSTMFDEPPMFYEQIAAVNGPMARHIGDLRLALNIMSRPDPSDPVWTPAIAPPASQPASLRVGLVTDPSGDGVAPNVADAMAAAAQSLQQAGYWVETVEPPLIELADETIQKLAEAEVATYVDDLLPMISADAGQVLKSVIGESEFCMADYRAAIAERHRIARAWSLLMDRYPLIMGPVSTMEAFAVGFDVSGRDAMRRLIRSFRLTELCNLLGLPSVAVSVNVAGGLPQGVQIIGRRFDEDRCFDAAEIIEKKSSVRIPIDPFSTG